MPVILLHSWTIISLTIAFRVLDSDSAGVEPRAQMSRSPVSLCPLHEYYSRPTVALYYNNTHIHTRGKSYEPLAEGEGGGGGGEHMEHVGVVWKLRTPFRPPRATENPYQFAVPVSAPRV